MEACRAIPMPSLTRVFEDAFVDRSARADRLRILARPGGRCGTSLIQYLERSLVALQWNQPVAFPSWRLFLEVLEAFTTFAIPPELFKNQKIE
jgi:hypothetical protein